MEYKISFISHEWEYRSWVELKNKNGKTKAERHCEDSGKRNWTSTKQFSKSQGLHDLTDQGINDEALMSVLVHHSQDDLRDYQQTL
jgi:hypothetical protein